MPLESGHDRNDDSKKSTNINFASQPELGSVTSTNKNWHSSMLSIFINRLSSYKNVTGMLLFEYFVWRTVY